MNFLIEFSSLKQSSDFFSITLSITNIFSAKCQQNQKSRVNYKKQDNYMNY